MQDVEYKPISNGDCVHGGEIKTLQECSAAARYLQLSADTATEDLGSTSFKPPFCYLQNGRVSFNPGGNAGSCSQVDACLCLQPKGLS